MKNYKATMTFEFEDVDDVIDDIKEAEEAFVIDFNNEKEFKNASCTLEQILPENKQA